MRIAVALATYNGGRWLDMLLASLDAQHLRPTFVIAADDGSVDDTRPILESWARRHPGWLRILLPDQGRPASPVHNFARALLAARELPIDAVAPCDQDDVWLPEKLAVLAATLEHCVGPALAVSDLLITTSDITTAVGPFWRHQRFHPHRCIAPRRTVVMNAFPGCAMLVNRALLEVAIPIPATAAMHDWWLSLLASICGVIRIVEQPLVAYRQHDANAVGTHRSLRERLRRIHRGRSSLTLAARQALAARERLSALGRRSAEIDSLIHAVACSGLRRRWAMARGRLAKDTWPRTLWMYLTC